MYKPFLLLLVFLVAGPCEPGSAQTMTNVPATNVPANGVKTEINPEAKDLYKTGLDLFEGGEYTKAADSFQRALKVAPEFADAYDALGRAYFKMREWQKAIDSFRHAAFLNTKARKNQEEIHKALVSQRVESAKTESAVSVTSKAVAPMMPTPSTVPPRAVNGSITKTNPTLEPVSLKTSSGSAKATPAVPTPSTAPSSAVNVSPTKSNPTAEPISLKTTSGSATAASAKPTPSTAPSSAVNLSPTKSNPTAEPVSLKTSSGSATATPATPTPSTAASSVVNVSTTKSNPTEEPVSLKTSSGSATAPDTSVRSIAPVEEVALTKTYRVGPNDVLDIRLNDPNSDSKSTLFTITPAGLLEHPLLSEPLAVNGLTVDEVGAKIEDELKRLALVENPKVAIGVRDYASHTILVSGLVKESGTKILRREAIPLYVVVADAQPLPEATKVTVVRNETNQMYEIDLTASAEMNLLVRSGDVVTLLPHETQFIYIGGEVKSPGEKLYRRGLTLTQALLSAGGLDGKAKSAQIARDDGRGFLTMTRFKLSEIEMGKTADPLLKPGDRITILR
jgi:protein involved in polysaccharide export with SLBB domain